MTARDEERDLLNRCAAAAKGELMGAADQREANVFRLASMVLRPRLPAESTRLRVASEQYFHQHPAELVESAQVVRNGWVMSVPRLRDMLTLQLHLG
ncbi:hypothetical protein [Cupriavidus campinensis]